MEKGTIVKHLIEAQKNFGAVTFDKTNPHFKSKFASLESMIKATRPALAEKGLIVIQPWMNTPEGNILMYTSLLHENGDCIKSECLIIRGNKTDQQLGSSITYARRYQYASLLNLVAEEEDDGEAEEDRNRRESPYKAQEATNSPKAAITPLTSWKPAKPAVKAEKGPLETLEDIVMERFETNLGLQDFIDYRVAESQKTANPATFMKVVEAALSSEGLTTRFCELYKQFMKLPDRAIDE